MEQEGGVVFGEGQAQLADRVVGAGGQAAEGGDLSGEAAQVGCVGAGPGGHGAVGGAGVACDLDAFLAGASDGTGTQA
ncbi:hypothetical protein [Streptomyces sp. NPDC059708]|uniref:hypothetical protein n=1 Tax=Streptomyces sp. NPDC059708 TaxID=3346916 RepID=UPI00369D94E2